MSATVAEVVGMDLTGMRPSAVEYWSQPYAVRWVHSHASGTHCFPTLAAAFEYIDAQWHNIRRRVASERYCASQLGQCELIADGQRIPMRYVLMCADVSSY
jgi:hypothetical protein